MKKLTFTELINGYETLEGGEMPFFSRSFSGNLTGIRKKSKTLSAIAALGERLAYTSMRIYGIMLLVFGVLTILIQFIKSSFLTAGDNVYSTLIIGASFALISTVFIAFDKPMATALQEWAVSDYILFDFFRIKRMYRVDKVPGLHPIIAVFVAIIPAAIGYFVPTYAVTAVIGIGLFVYMALISPEFSFFITVMMLPFLPIIPYGNTVTCALVFVTAFSFLVKVLRGKRFLRLEQYDIILGAIGLIVLILGIFIGGLPAFRSSLTVISAILLFFVASNAITNRNLAECAISAIALSSVPVSIIAIVEFAKAAAAGIDIGSFELNSTFTSAASFAAFSATAAVSSVIMAKCREKEPSCAVFILTAALSVIALGFALRFDVLIFLILSLIIISATKKNRNLIFLTIVVYILAHIPMFLPKNLLIAITKPVGLDGFVEARLSLLRFGFDTFLKRPITGGGIGLDGFENITEEALGTAYGSAQNLLLQLALEVGIIATLLFIWLILARLRHVRRYSLYIEEDAVSYFCYGTSAILFITLLIGVYGYVFADTSMLSLFFTVFGIGGSMLRASKRAHDDKRGYFNDEKSNDFSAVDVELTR